MLKKRIIACLDVDRGRTVKGVRFVDIRDAGDPVALAAQYADQGVDELVLLDISASIEGRKIFTEQIECVAAAIDIPFTVGGGISSVEDAARLLRAGADKLSVNSAAVRRPGLISDLAERFGAQCIVVAIDADYLDGHWRVFVNGGRVPTDLDVVEWAQTVEKLGAGEILLTSMQHDGVRSGFNCDLTSKVANAVCLPVIASGGAGRSQDFVNLFQQTPAQAGLAAGIFHFGDLGIGELKQILRKEGVAVR